jgi:hypothetical protein
MIIANAICEGEWWRTHCDLSSQRGWRPRGKQAFFWRRQRTKRTDEQTKERTKERTNCKVVCNSWRKKV